MATRFPISHCPELAHRTLTTADEIEPTPVIADYDNRGGPGRDRQPSGTLNTRVPQLRAPVVVWLDLGGMYSVANHAESDVPSGTAKE